MLEKNGAKKVALLLAWLHQSLINEILIIEHTALDTFKYAEVLNSIFERNLARRLCNQVA